MHITRWMLVKVLEVFSDK